MTPQQPASGTVLQLEVDGRNEHEQEGRHGEAGHANAPGASGSVEPGRVRRVPAAGEPGRRDAGAAETTDYAAFNAAIARNPHREFLTDHTAEELAQGQVFLSEDHNLGYAVSPDGDLQNVFRNDGAPSGSGAEAVRYAVERRPSSPPRRSASTARIDLRRRASIR